MKLDGYARDVAVEHNYSLSAETPTTSDLVWQSSQSNMTMDNLPFTSMIFPVNSSFIAVFFKMFLWFSHSNFHWQIISHFHVTKRYSVKKLVLSAQN